MRRSPSHAFVLAALAMAAACGGSPTGPTPYQPPTLICPADVQAESHQGQPAMVTYTVPTAVNGTPPVTVACTPASGSSFGIGTTKVTCTATDSQTRTATCDFSVVVTAVPVVSKVKFVAFGDSITEGTVSPDPTTLTVNSTASYPYKLQGLLAQRYVDQTVTVVNEGKAGEPLNPDGVRRFPTVLSNDTPEVALILDGANDLLCASGDACGGGDPFAAIPRIVGGLEDLVKIARQRHVVPLVATFPPQNVHGSRGGGAPAVPDLNAAIARMVADEDAVLVDLYNGLGGTPTGSIGVDGLHPTETGYTKIAEIWFEAIQREFEQPSPAGTGRPVLLIAPGWN